RTKEGKELDPMPIVARPRMLVALVAHVALVALPASADEPKPTPEPIPPVANTVKLDLQLSGVAAGWTIEVKPANPGSRFKPVLREIDQADGGPVRLDEIALDARSLGADRHCALAIVLTDPEGTSQTFKRSV